MAEILLAGKDWQARALLRAQLIEEGFEVEAYEAVPEALASLASCPRLPALLVADLTASEQPAADAEKLAAWSRHIPTWIIASRSMIFEKSLDHLGFEMILFRPVDVGELIDQIKQRLGRG